MRGPSWRDLPATARQLHWLHQEHWLTWGRRWYEPRGLTRGQASDLIEQWRRVNAWARQRAGAPPPSSRP